MRRVILVAAFTFAALCLAPAAKAQDPCCSAGGPCTSPNCVTCGWVSGAPPNFQCVTVWITAACGCSYNNPPPYEDACTGDVGTCYYCYHVYCCYLCAGCSSPWEPRGGRHPARTAELRKLSWAGTSL